MKFQISKNCEYVLKAVDDGYQDHQFLSCNSPKMSRYDEKLLQKGCRKVQIALFSYFLQIFLKLAIRRRFLQKSVLRDPLWCYIWWYISFGPTKHLRSCQTKSCFGPFLHDSFCGTHHGEIKEGKSPLLQEKEKPMTKEYSPPPFRGERKLPMGGKTSPP